MANSDEKLHSNNNTFAITGVLSSRGSITFSTTNGTRVNSYDILQDAKTLTLINRDNYKCNVQLLKDGATDITPWKLYALIGGVLVVLIAAYCCYRKCCTDSDDDIEVNSTNKDYKKLKNPTA